MIYRASAAHYRVELVLHFRVHCELFDCSRRRATEEGLGAQYFVRLSCGIHEHNFTVALVWFVGAVFASCALVLAMLLQCCYKASHSPCRRQRTVRPFVMPWPGIVTVTLELSLRFFIGDVGTWIACCTVVSSVSHY